MVFGPKRNAARRNRLKSGGTVKYVPWTVDRDPLEVSSIMFFIAHQVLSPEEATKLLEIRKPLDENIRNQKASKSELAIGIKLELTLLRELKIKVPRDDKGVDSKPNKVYTILCKRIISLFEYMHKNYSIEDMLDLILSFCHENAIYFNENNVRFLSEAVCKIENNENIWIKLFTLYADMELYDKMLAILSEAVKYLDSNFLPTWKRMIHCIIEYYPKSIIPAFVAGSQLPYENIAQEIRYQYSDWTTK